jgi:predicted DNA-binding transcriptional regulator
MKLIRNLFTCGVLLLLCSAAAMAQSVQTDYDRNFNLANLKTYGFYQQERGARDPLAASPINDRRIHDALIAQLNGNGFTSSDTPDFLIGYFVSTKAGLDIQDNRFGWFQRRGSVNVEQVTEGTLVVVFVDAKTKQEVWRGYATGTINPKNLNEDVNKAVTKLVQKFKKNQSGKN